jgi:hypothetical protein
MSEMSSSDIENTLPAKKKVSPARNAIGLVVLIVVVIIGCFQYAAFFGFKAAVKALDTRMGAEDKDLVSEQEAESMFGRSPDGPGSDFQDRTGDFTKKTYTWWGPLKSFTVTAFYAKRANPFLHHYETEGAKLEPEPTVEPIAVDPSKAARRGGGGLPRGSGAPKRAKSKNADPAKGAAPIADSTKPDAAKAAVPEKGTDTKPTSQAPKPATAKVAAPDSAPK